MLVGGLVLWFGPASPDAIAQTDVMLARGDVARAADRYREIAELARGVERTARALERSARVRTVELADFDGAQRDLEELAGLVHDPARLAGTYAALAELLLADRRPSEAADAFLAAASAYGGSPDAAVNRIRAAYAQLDAGDRAGAEVTWKAIAARHAAYRGRAYLALARLHLERDDSEAALSWFERALEASHGGPEAAAARLGVGTCLARLGDLDQALAQIDAAELPAHVRAVRADALRVRQGSL